MCALWEMWDSYEKIYKVTKSQVSRQIHKYL